MPFEIACPDSFPQMTERIEQGRQNQLPGLQVYDQGPKADHSELKIWLQNLNKATFHLMAECIMILLSFLDPYH